MFAVFRFYFAATLLAGPAISQSDLEGILEQLPDSAGWEELCEIADCDRFPIGYNTYAFGPSVYHFPTIATMTVKPPDVLAGGVKAGRFFETDINGHLQRSLSVSGGTIVANCCHYLLVFYDLADDVPQFREVDGNRMPTAWATFASGNKPHRDNKAFRYFDVPSNAQPKLDTLISENQASFNNDFWLTKSREPDEIGDRAFHIVSKRPLLNGYHVLARCGLQGCSVNTLALADTEGETRPHVSLRHMTLTNRDEYLCISDEHENECDPAPEVFEKVIVLLGIIEDMFEAASVYPAN